jgi:predicted membrane metal-binding protein
VPALLPSELPVRARTRHHWIVLFRPPHKLLGVALLVIFVAAAVQPNPMAYLLGLVVAGLAFLRWQTWQAESVILTGKRIIRVQGVPETTSSEASLRVDRISGARLVESVPGKLLGYGTIELEAPGDHPDVRRLKKIAQPREFYLQLRSVVFGDGVFPDPDDDPRDFVTEPLPVLPPERDRFGRRRS